MTEKQCKTCKYFMQHFSMDEHRIFRVYCGHCMFERPKRKHPHTKACENYFPSPAPEDAFVSKEYLSKALLWRVLNMELLPKIEDQE